MTPRSSPRIPSEPQFVLGSIWRLLCGLYGKRAKHWDKLEPMILRELEEWSTKPEALTARAGR